MKVLLIDGYIDTPGCLGVPPYLSPIVRYIYGVLNELTNERGELDVDSLIIAIKSMNEERIKHKTQIEYLDFIVSGTDRIDKSMNTRAVIFDMIATARKEIIILSYLYVKTARSIIDALKQSEKRGVNLIILGECKNLERIAKSWKSNNSHKPRFFVYQPQSEYQSMHAKIILVDRKDLLITSANLTKSGLSTNTEFGVRIKGEICRKAYSLIKNLIDTKIFVGYYP